MAGTSLKLLASKAISGVDAATLETNLNAFFAGKTDESLVKVIEVDTLTVIVVYVKA